MNKFLKKSLLLTSMFFLASCSPTQNVNNNVKSDENQNTDQSETKHEHNYILVGEVKATIFEEGTHEHYKCNCGKLFDSSFKEVSLKDLKYKHDFYSLCISKEPVYLMHGNTEIRYTPKDYEAHKTSLTEMIVMVKNGTARLKILTETRNAGFEYYFALSEDYKIIEMLANANNRTEDYELTTEIYNKQIEFYNLVYKLEVAILRSTKYRADIFGVYSDYEYEATAQYYEKKMIDESRAESQEILAKYKSGELEAYPAISQYVAAANELAQSYDYPDYLNYAYGSIYGRNYSVNDTDFLGGTKILSIVELYEDFYNAIEDFKETATTDLNYQNAIDENISLNQDFFGTHIESLNSYAKYIGDVYVNNYENYFNDGYYYFSNVENENITGYVSHFPVENKPYMFLGRNYQGATTFIHEFGHYNADFTYPSIDDYDLAETQSQGNEMLYYLYLSDNYYDETTAKYCLLKQVCSFLGIILDGYIINEVEKFIYCENPNFTKNELESKYIEIGASIDLDYSNLIDYLYLVLLNYQGYYISYALSAIASLEILVSALLDRESGREKYISIYTNSSPDVNEGFDEALENAGLYNVFDWDAFDYLQNLRSLL